MRSNKIREATLKKEGKILIGHSYVMVSELPLELLHTTYQDHNRLRVFAAKGTTCVKCNCVGTRLIVGEDRAGGYHTDVYTQDLKLITIDHIMPKSRGGSNDLDNLQPMCSPCNSRKADHIDAEQIIVTMSKFDG